MHKKRIFRFVKWFFGIVFGLMFLITMVLYIYKDDICGMVISEVNKNFKAKIKVSDVDLAFWGSFPNLSIDFNQVFIQESFEGSTELDTLLYSDRIRLKINPLDIWRENYTVKSIEVSPGTIKLQVNEEGINNFDILKEKKDSLVESEFDFNLELVEFEDFRFSYINHATDQEYTTLIRNMSVEGAFKSSVFTAKANSDLQIISARSGNITLVSNQPAVLNVAVDVNKNLNTVNIPLSTIYVANLPFNFSGNVTNDGFKFNLNGKNIKIEDAANNLAMRETSDVKLFSGQGILLFDLAIEGKYIVDEPVMVDCNFGVSSATLKDPSSGIRLSKLKLDGLYTNRGGETKERLDLKNISFQTSGGPFKGNLLITNFANPLFEGNADGSINLAVVHSLFNIPQVQSLNGAVDVHSDFIVQGETTPAQTTDYYIKKCEGHIQMHHVDAQLIGDKRKFESMNGLLYLRNNEAGLENITLKVGRTDFKLNGVFKDIVNYFSGKGDLTADVEISSKRIYLEDLGTDTKEEKILRDRSYILPKNIKGTVYLDVEHLEYDGHSFDKIIGNMSISKGTIHFPHLSVRNGGAEVLGTLTIEERAQEIFYISSKLSSKNINFTKLFKEWDNFKQEVITSDNIQGDAQASLIFEAPFDLRSGVISNAIIAQINIQIDNGRLKNVETFNAIIKSLKSSSIRVAIGKENIDAFGAKLQDLKFKQLKNTLLIKNGVMTIPTMSIQSSALDIEASGTHTFRNKIDYRFGFKYRDLKQKKESEFGSIVDDETGMQIFMRMYGDLDNPTIEWDKESRKLNTQEYNAKEKENFKSIMKSELGLFKNDTTVKNYIKTEKLKEELIIDFDPVHGIEPLIEEKKPPKKDSKINKALQKWKAQEEAEKKEGFEIDEF